MSKERINICGMTYEIEEKEDVFTSDGVHFGEVDFTQNKIMISKSLTAEQKEATIFHEILHAILTTLGYQNESNNEQFVCSVSNAMYQTFTLKRNMPVEVALSELEYEIKPVIAEYILSEVAKMRGKD